MSNENATTNNPPVKKNPEQGKYHAIILYPDDPMHMNVLHYLQTQKVYKFIAMRHRSGEAITEEEKEEGQEESQNGGCKEHYHVMVEVPKKQTAKGFQRIFGGIIAYSIVVKSEIDYILYMQHKTFKAQYIDHKEPYSFEEFISNDIQHFAHMTDETEQLQEVAALVEMCKEATLDDVVMMIAQGTQEQQITLWRALKANQNLISQCSNQILRYKGVGINKYEISKEI